MQVIDSPEQDPAAPEAGEKDPLARFRSWRGFLFAALAVYVLFAYAMAGNTDASVGTWYKALVWLPFNAIATAVYLAIMARLSRPDKETAGSNSGGALYAVVCVVMIIANWMLMLFA